MPVSVVLVKPSCVYWLLRCPQKRSYLKVSFSALLDDELSTASVPQLECAHLFLLYGSECICYLLVAVIQLRKATQPLINVRAIWFVKTNVHVSFCTVAMTSRFWTCQTNWLQGAVLSYFRAQQFAVKVAQQLTPNILASFCIRYYIDQWRHQRSSARRSLLKPSVKELLICNLVLVVRWCPSLVHSFYFILRPF